MNRLPTFFLQVLAYPLLAAAQSAVPDANVEVREVNSSARTDFKTSIAPLLAKDCTGCHGGEKPKNDLSLEFSDAQQVEQKRHGLPILAGTGGGTLNPGRFSRYNSLPVCNLYLRMRDRIGGNVPERFGDSTDRLSDI
jgi:hypothetical protein